MEATSAITVGTAPCSNEGLSSVIERAIAVSWDDVTNEDLIYLYPRLASRNAMRESGAARLLSIIETTPSANSPYAGILASMRARLHLIQTRGASTSSRQTITYADALHGAFAAGFNSAYVFDEHAYANESLSAAAWIGRAAINGSVIPPLHLAASITAVFDELPPRTDSRWSQMRAVAQEVAQTKNGAVPHSERRPENSPPRFAIRARQDDRSTSSSGPLTATGKCRNV